MYVITAACLNPVHHVSVCQEWRERNSEQRERYGGRSRSAYSELKETDGSGTDTGRGEEDSRCCKTLLQDALSNNQALGQNSIELKDN